MSFAKTNFIKLTILSFFALLIFVLSIPGTIALRNILAVFLLLFLSIDCFKDKTYKKLLSNEKSLINLFLILFALTIYIFLHSIFIADEVSWSLSQYKSQWVYPMLYFLMGVLIAFSSAHDKYFNQEVLTTILFYSLFIHICYIDIVALAFYLDLITIMGDLNGYGDARGSLLIRYGGLTESPVSANYITNILNSIIIVEFIYRYKVRKQMLKISSFPLFLIFLLCIFSSIVEGMRFGAMNLFFLGILSVIFFNLNNKNNNFKVKSVIVLIFLSLSILPLIINSNNDSRWSSLIETIPIALDTEKYTYWKGDSLDVPKLSNGQNVSHSNYMRIAWGVKGVEYIFNDVFGIGYGRNAFGHAIEKYEKVNQNLDYQSHEKYETINPVRGYHSHISIIDFTIGVGLIGLFMWLYFLLMVIKYSFSIFLRQGNYFALLTIFITSGFFVRSLIDSNMRDHMFKQFFLILGITITLTYYQKLRIKNV